MSKPTGTEATTARPKPYPTRCTEAQASSANWPEVAIAMAEFTASTGVGRNRASTTLAARSSHHVSNGPSTETVMRIAFTRRDGSIRSVAIGGGTRSQSQHDCQVDIGIQQKFSKGDPAELDPLMDLVQELIDYLRARPLTAYPTAVWHRTQNEPVYSIEHFDQLRQFTSVVTLTYRLLR